MPRNNEASTDVAVEAKPLRQKVRGALKTVLVLGTSVAIISCVATAPEKLSGHVDYGIKKEASVGPTKLPDTHQGTIENFGGENPRSIFPTKEIKHGDVLENLELGATASLYPNPRASDKIDIDHIDYPRDGTRGGSVHYKSALITHAEWKEISGEHVLVYSGIIKGKPFTVWNIVYRGEKLPYTDDGVISNWVFYIRGKKSKKKPLSQIKKMKGITPEEIRRRRALADSIKQKATAEKVRMQIGDLAKK